MAFIKSAILGASLGLVSALGAEAQCRVVIPFDSGSTALSGAAQAVIARIGQAYPSASMSITGHTDAVGSAATNQALSQARANAVQSALGNAGVQGSAVVSNAGKAANNLRVATNAPSAVNRRVEIDIPSCDPAVLQGPGAQVAPNAGLPGPTGGFLAGTGGIVAAGAISVILGGISSTSGTN